MKKYRVTRKHIGLIKGCIIQKRESFKDKYEILMNSVFIGNIDVIYLADWIGRDWIEEIQEPEFTRDDLFDFGQYINHNATPGTRYTDEGINSLIVNWLEFTNRKK